MLLASRHITYTTNCEYRQQTLSNGLWTLDIDILMPLLSTVMIFRTWILHGGPDLCTQEMRSMLARVLLLLTSRAPQYGSHRSCGMTLIGQRTSSQLSRRH